MDGADNPRGAALTVRGLGTAGRNRNRSVLSAKYTFDDIIHISNVMNSVVAQCRQVAKTDSSVMIYGETGTGKELFAQSIHNESRRADGPPGPR